MYLQQVNSLVSTVSKKVEKSRSCPDKQRPHEILNVQFIAEEVITGLIADCNIIRFQECIAKGVPVHVTGCEFN